MGDENEHRRASSQAHGYSTDGASPANQGAGQADHRADALGALNPYPGPGAGMNQTAQFRAAAFQATQQLMSHAMAHQLRAQQAAMAIYSQSIYGYSAFRNRFIHIKVPDAGISVGEIIGWRAWMIDPFWPNCEDLFLESVSAMAKWIPDKPMIGDPDKTWEGVHSFKTKKILEQNMPTGRFVLGTIFMWGRVIEHEFGYRAEFAKVRSIYQLPFELRTIGGRNLKRLRRLYRVDHHASP